MQFSDAVSYTIAMIAITLAPGPIALVLVARSASRDLFGALSFGLGYAVGGILIVAAVCFGLAAWLTAVPDVFILSKYVMLAFVLWMAFGIWKGGFDLSQDGDTRPVRLLPGFCTGITASLVSPYMLILFPLVMPELMDITRIEIPEFLIIAVLTFTARMAGVALLVGLAAQLCRLARSPGAMRALNRSLAGLLALGGGWMALA
jgi:threonine/homoserine/homoserine lactone efflux protein